MHTNYLRWETIMRERTDPCSLEFPLAHQAQATASERGRTRRRQWAASFAPVQGTLACGLRHTHPLYWYSFWLMRPSQFTKPVCAVVSPVAKQIPSNAKSEELMLGKVELIFSSAGSSAGLLPHTRESFWTKQNWQISRCRASDKWAVPLSLVCARGEKIKTKFSE